MSANKKISTPIPKKVSMIIQGVQFISAHAAFKLAKKYFFTPRKYATPEREMEYKHSCIVSREMVNNKRIMVYHGGKGKRKILLVHGWSGRATQFFRIAPALIKAGFKVYSFTAPAHGSSDDKHTHMMEFSDCIVYLEKQHGPFEAIVGHSIGAAAALRAHLRGVKAKKIVALGAPGSTREIVEDFCRNLGFNQTVVSKLLADLKKQFGEDIEQFSVPTMAAKATIEGLIIHDKTDKDVKVDSARKNHEIWKNSKYIETSGLGHQLILTDKRVIKEIVDYLQ